MKHRLALGITVVVLAFGQAASGATPPGRSQTTRPVVVRVGDGGFRWGDAAIGAAGATGALLLLRGLIVGVHATRRRRR